MDSKREMSSSSSFSFTAHLFGTKESPPSSSTGTFASILSPPSTAMGRSSSNPEVIGSWQKQPSGNQARNIKKGTPALHAESGSCNIPNKDKSSIFQEERTEPCHLSSSLYYGGQDIYSHSPGTHASASYSMKVIINFGHFASRLRKRMLATWTLYQELNQVRLKSGADMKRKLMWYDLVALGAGGMLGVAVFVTTGHVALQIYGPSVFISYIIAGISSSLSCSPVVSFFSHCSRS